MCLIASATSSSGRTAAEDTSSGNPEPLVGRVALVTGASRGIGRAIAVRLAMLGADVGLVQRSDAADTAAEVRQQGRRASVVEADLGDAEACERAVAAVVTELERLDIAVCNAGAMVRAPALELEVDDWRRVIDVNLTGAFVVSRLAARRFVAQGGGGRVVHIASMMSFHAGINTAAYAASKGGIAQLTKAQANEWAPLGIRLGGDRSDGTATRRRTALCRDLGPHSGRSLGNPGRYRRRGCIPVPARVGLRQRSRAAGRRRMARAIGSSTPT